MHWFLFAGLAMILIATAFRVPKLAFSMFCGLLALAAALYYTTGEEEQSHLVELESSMVEIRDIKMASAYAGAFRATGVIVNKSDEFDISGLSVRFSVNDCPSETALSLEECKNVSHTTEPLQFHIPANGSVAFEQSVLPRKIKVEGSRRWSFKVLNVEGRRPLRFEKE